MEPLVNLHNSLFYEAADSRTRIWPLLGSPLPVLAITGVWLAFVLRIGPHFMSNRKPFHLHKFIMIINGGQVFANLYVLYEFLAAGWTNNYNFQCEPCDYSQKPSALRMARACYIYLLLKLLDMVDTVIYVLRRKTNQISFLHLYHHLSTLLLAWVVANYAPGGHGTLVQLLNTFVHVIMYTYYFISALGPSFQKYLWWKRYLTRMQLLQFVIQFGHNVNALRIDCKYPHAIIYLFLPIISVMFILFLNFYIEKYLERNANKKKQ